MGRVVGLFLSDWITVRGVGGGGDPVTTIRKPARIYAYKRFSRVAHCGSRI